MNPESKCLLFVDPVKNHNKFYNIIVEPGASEIKCEFGRVGQSKQVVTKPLSAYDRILREKLNKGYKDMTDNFKKTIATTLDTSVDSIKDIGAKDLISKFLQFSNQSIKQNYTIDKSSVNMTAIQKVEQYISTLEDMFSQYKAGTTFQNDEKGFVNAFKNIQLKIFQTVPRRIKKVQDACIQHYDQAEIERVLKNERDLIDTLKTNIQMSTPQAATTASTSGSSAPVQDYLTNLGLELHEVHDQAKIDEIKDMMGDCKKYFNRLFIAVNHETQSKFENFMSQHSNCTPTLFFHGSRNQNWMSILKNGLKIRPAGSHLTGAMLGWGIYGAPLAKKSINYTSLRNLSYNSWGSNDSEFGYMALFAFAIDKDKYFDYTSNDRDMSKLQTKNAYDVLQTLKPGATYVWGHKDGTMSGAWLREDEIAVYKEEQVTIRYIIECKN